ncbi:arsenate reductase ArsC [Tessaracoccus sp. OS52]|nr:arsenate reductase ArsC [Tessaracoccus sp. OS52]MCC2592981.1 arsenate reductase ArsC [Tessaracoccus sp. OS52]
MRAAAKSKGEPLDGRPELLFVCVQNAGRSQLAAAMAKHFSGGQVNVRSAGSRPSGQINPDALRVLEERGIEAAYLFSKPLTTDALQASDVVITMGCGDECPFYPGKRYEDWKLDDPNGQSIETVRRIADEIEVKVKGLLAEIL